MEPAGNKYVLSGGFSEKLFQEALKMLWDLRSFSEVFGKTSTTSAQMECKYLMKMQITSV